MKNYNRIIGDLKYDIELDIFKILKKQDNSYYETRDGTVIQMGFTKENTRLILINNKPLNFYNIEYLIDFLDFLNEEIPA